MKALINIDYTYDFVAVDAYNKGFKIVVYKDAVASFNQAGHEWALGHLNNP